MESLMSSSLSNAEEDDELEAAVDQAIAACGGDTRSTIRALIVANEYLEAEAAELMKGRLCARQIQYLFRVRRRHPGAGGEACGGEAGIKTIQQR